MQGSFDLITVQIVLWRFKNVVYLPRAQDAYQQLECIVIRQIRQLS